MFRASSVVTRSAAVDRVLLAKMRTLAKIACFAQLITICLIMDCHYMVYLVNHSVVKSSYAPQLARPS